MNEAWTELKNELEASREAVERRVGGKAKASVDFYDQGYLDALLYAVEMMEAMEDDE